MLMQDKNSDQLADSQRRGVRGHSVDVRLSQTLREDLGDRR
jgi:hypothetical protein